jgi:hypothetical protein
MTCPACQEAEASPWLCGSYQSQCISCESRAIVKSPHGSQALKDALLGHPGALQAIMRQLWPDPETYRQGRVLTYNWAKAIDKAKEKQ